MAKRGKTKKYSINYEKIYGIKKRKRMRRKMPKIKRLDVYEVRIIRTLEIIGEGSINKIAKEGGISWGTAKKKINQLIKKGYLRESWPAKFDRLKAQRKEKRLAKLEKEFNMLKEEEGMLLRELIDILSNIEEEFKDLKDVEE